MDSPHARPLTGRGLLREICYLNRLRRLPDTVVVCDADYQPTLDDLIALGGAMGIATDIHGNLVTPRLAAIDKQVGHLRKAYRGITYRRPGGDSPVLPRLADALGTAVQEILDRGRTSERSPADLENLTGTSPSPRPLPPDGKLKIVSRTPVEDVLFLPSGPLVGGPARGDGAGPQSRGDPDRVPLLPRPALGDVLLRPRPRAARAAGRQRRDRLAQRGLPTLRPQIQPLRQRHAGAAVIRFGLAAPRGSA